MRIIITGATGSLGAFLTRYFSSHGHEVIACGRDVKPPERLTVYARYLCTDITGHVAFPEDDVCIHAAALVDDRADMEALYGPNVTGTENVSRAASGCKKFIFISSSAVYPPADQPLTENMADRQNNKLLSPYGYSKLLAEEVLQHSDVAPACFILRPRAIYGAGDHVILPRMMKLVKKGTFSRPGKMKVNLSMTHYDNMAVAITCCLESTRKGLHVYNVADDQTYVLTEVTSRIFEAVYKKSLPEKEIPISFLKLMALFRFGGITPLLVRSFTQDMVLDISRIKKELGYRAVTDLSASLDSLRTWVSAIGGPEILKTGDRRLAWA